MTEEKVNTILTEGGQQAIIRIGNTVIDILHGYNGSGRKEPVAIIDIYPYDDKKENRTIVRYDNQIVYSK